MRCILILALAIILAGPATAQQLDFLGSRGGLQVSNGNVQVHSNRGTSLTIPNPSGGQPGLSVSGASAAPQDLVVTRGSSGEWVFQDNSRGESAVIDLTSGGMTRVQSPRGSYTVPTSLLRDFLGNDQEAVQFFQVLGR